MLAWPDRQTGAGMSEPNSHFQTLMIQLIDEVMRGHGRFVVLSDTFSTEGDPAGLMRTVLTSVIGSAVPPTVPQIGRSLGYPRQTIQRQADTLVAEGFLEWIDNPDHKKARRLVPTDKGRCAHARAKEKSEAWADRFSARLDQEEVRKLADVVDLLRKIRKEVEADLRYRQPE